MEQELKKRLLAILKAHDKALDDFTLHLNEISNNPQQAGMGLYGYMRGLLDSTTINLCQEFDIPLAEGIKIQQATMAEYQSAKAIASLTKLLDLMKNTPPSE